MFINEKKEPRKNFLQIRVTEKQRDVAKKIKKYHGCNSMSELVFILLEKEYQLMTEEQKKES